MLSRIAKRHVLRDTETAKAGLASGRAHKVMALASNMPRRSGVGHGPRSGFG
jgi:hypothetical protein